jgi:UV DNA damage repair endonuclease
MRNLNEGNVATTIPFVVDWHHHGVISDIGQRVNGHAREMKLGGEDE